MHFTTEDNALYLRALNLDLPSIPDGLTMRRATAENYDGVMGFSEGVLGGRLLIICLPCIISIVHPKRYLLWPTLINNLYVLLLKPFTLISSRNAHESTYSRVD